MVLPYLWPAADRAHDEQAGADDGGVRDADALHGAGQAAGLRLGIAVGAQPGYAVLASCWGRCWS